MYTKLALTLALIGLAAAGVPWVAEPRADSWWKTRHQHLLNMTHQHAADVKVVFYGDSITEGWAGNGKKVWDKYYAPRHSYNYGIGGDRTEHLLWRLDNGEFDHVKPKLVVLKIGTNNIGTNTALDISKGIHAIIEDIHKRMPDAKVLLLSVLPRQPANVDTIVHDINKIISRFADHHRVHYLDLAVHFEISLGHEHAELFVPDHVHLSEKGYEMWYKVMEPSFKKLIE